jgi:hypothetical protein
MYLVIMMHQMVFYGLYLITEIVKLWKDATS